MGEFVFPTIRRISHTPMRDVLRLRVTGRLDHPPGVSHSIYFTPFTSLFRRRSLGYGD